jgi:hypothetical protein
MSRDILQRSPASHNPFHGDRENFPRFSEAFAADAAAATPQAKREPGLFNFDNVADDYDAGSFEQSQLDGAPPPPSPLLWAAVGRAEGRTFGLAQDLDWT